MIEPSALGLLLQRRRAREAAGSDCIYNPSSLLTFDLMGIHMWVHMDIHMWVHMDIHMWVHMCIHMWVSMEISI